MEASVVEAVENELSCPICYEDFEEPKCLPNCAHNICQNCLERMAKRKRKVIECPVCRVKSVIPNGGVVTFPKNHLLVRLLENSALKERKSMKHALENCKSKIENAKADLKETEEFLVTAKSQAEETKQKIKSLADQAVFMVRKQERQMFHEIDQRLRDDLNEGAFATHKMNTLKLCDNASSCVQATREELQNGRMSLKDSSEDLVQKLNNFSTALDTRMVWAECEFKQSFEVSLTNSDSLEKFVSEKKSLIGELNITTSTPAARPKLLKYSRSGSLIQIIDNHCLHGTTQFSPFSVAVSRLNGHFAVLDVGGEMKHVHIFKENGEPLSKFCIKQGDPWDVALLKGIEVVVLDRESNRLLYFNLCGIVNSKKKSVTSPPREKVKFSSLSVDLNGYIIISSCPCFDETNTLPCILIYNPSGELVSLVGEGILLTPEKAVSLNGKYFVADSSKQSVIVFNKKGCVIRTIRGSQLAIPSCIAVDYSKQLLLVSDSGNSTIQIYNQQGTKQCWFQTEHAPIGVAFTKDSENMLICFSS